MSKVKRKKSLAGYIWECEFMDVLIKDENNSIKIDELYMPTTQKTLLETGHCNCGKNCKMVKVRITIE